MQGGGPTEVAVSSENQNLHFTRVFAQPRSSLRGHVIVIMGQLPESKLWRGCNWRESSAFPPGREPKQREICAGGCPGDVMAPPARMARSDQVGSGRLVPEGLPEP